MRSIAEELGQVTSIQDSIANGGLPELRSENSPNVSVASEPRVSRRDAFQDGSGCKQGINSLEFVTVGQSCATFQVGKAIRRQVSP
jgi:formylmethanofuran dehydrogenase subunit E